MANAEFRLTEDHLKLIRRSNVGWLQCEYGAPEIDPKRPYGNSNVESDIAEILGWEVPSKEIGGGYVETDYDNQAYQIFRLRCREIHRETMHALQIVCRYAGTIVEPGLYTKSNEFDYRTLERIGD